MKFIWKGKWREGEIIIEAKTLEELNNALKMLSSAGRIENTSEISDTCIPEIPSVQGCTDALRALMETDWAKQPRSMREIQKAMEANALYFSKGTLSGTLTIMTKKGGLRRVKEGGRWKYFAR